MLKIELKRALHSRGMYFALLVGILLSGSQIIKEQIPIFQSMEQVRLANPNHMLYPEIMAEQWMAGNLANVEGFLYFLIFPILAVLPHGTTYFEDRENGFLKMIYSRTDRKKYLKAKYASAFISGGLVVTLPLLLNVMVTMTLFPNLVPSAIKSGTLVRADCLFYQLYYTKPLLYIFIFLCIDFLMGGMWAVLAVACSYLSDYKIIVLLAPFFVQLILEIIWHQLALPENSSIYFLQAGHGIHADFWYVPLLYFGIGTISSWMIFHKKGEKEDVY